MYKIELKNFDILLSTDLGHITALQSGNSFVTGFDSTLSRALKNKLTEFLSMLNESINMPDSPTILDIGAGNSLFDIALAKTYPNSNFILVDGDNFDPMINKGIQHSSTYQTYNSWAPVFGNIELNGLDPAKFKAIDPSNGYWADAVWLYCTDEQYRPTKPGIFPLVDGPSRNRVGILRGAGNAIVAPVAQAFIEAFLEAMGG